MPGDKWPEIPAQRPGWAPCTKFAVCEDWVVLESFKEFPPRQKVASFTIDKIVEALIPGISPLQVPLTLP
jgi:hypothetical protein